MFTKIMNYLYISKLKRERQKLVDYHSRMAWMWEYSSHKKLRRVEREIDDLRDQIDSLTYA